jgi:hypothetical protein
VIRCRTILSVQPTFRRAVSNGKLHIFDTYAFWQVTPKFMVQGEGD